MKIINLTPHAVNIINADNTVITFPSEGNARCNQTTKKIGEINGIPLTETSFGEVIDLPEPNPVFGVHFTYYIVSRLVMQACPLRADLLVPNDIVRDSEGKIIGCKSFAVN
jgi:hypothetical protein